MTDLILHVGLPKAGSTTLQRVVFPRVGALGRHAATAQLVALRQYLRFAPPGIWATPAGARVTRELERWASDAPLVFSDEGPYGPFLGTPAWPFTNPGRMGWLARHLAALQRHGWPHGRVRAIVAIRRQSTYLASMYAHQAARLPGPNQADFERRVARLLDGPPRRGHASLAYDRLAARLADALGPENVHFCLLEGFGEAATWQRLAAFTGLPALAEPPALAGRSTVPKGRATAPDRWQLRGWDGKRWARRTAAAMRAPGAPTVFLAPLARRLDGLAAPRGSIALTPELDARIRASYADSNRRFSAATGLDLAPYGYFPDDSAD